MKRFSLFAITLFCFSEAFAYSIDDENVTWTAGSPPNILLVLTDDQGYGDLGSTGNPFIETPNIDQLMNQGVRFERFYVSPVCSPTRASILSGKSSLSTGVFHVTRGGEKMHPGITTLPEFLAEKGYVSGLFGKWHNGLQYPHNPIGQGFDEFYGFSEGHKTRYYDDVLQHNNSTVSFSGYIADSLTDKAIDFIAAHKEQPFFAMMSFNTPHGPFIAPKQYFDKYKQRGLSDLDASIYGMVENIDDNVARLLTTLDQLHLSQNTIVIYLSDNGAAFPKGITRYNAGLKGQKGKVDEGGVRTPFVIKWPAQFAEGKQVSQIAQHIDLVPTLLDAANISVPHAGFDGISLLPLLSNDKSNDVDWPERTLFTHRFRIAKDSSNDPVHLAPGAVRTQKWLATLDEQNRWQLFDLNADPSQSNDLSKTHPVQLNDLKGQYTSWFYQTINEHGPYQTQSIEVGHKGFEQTELPAHEGLLLGDKLRYQYSDGWAHDWITNQTANKVQMGISDEVKGVAKPQVYWPIIAKRSGQFEVYLNYATPKGKFDGLIQVYVDGKFTSASEIATFVPKELDSERQFYTSEAAEYTWQKAPIGIINLVNGKPVNLSLSLTSPSTKINYSNVDQILWIKGIELHQRLM